MDITNVSYDTIRDFFANDPHVLEPLEEFKKAKDKYLKTKDIQDKIELKMKYVDIYEEIKLAYYCHRYSWETFLAFKSFLQTLD